MAKQCKECKKRKADKTCELGFCLRCRREFFNGVKNIKENGWF